MRTVKIETQYGAVELSSNKPSEKMADLVGNALSIASELTPRDKTPVEPEYTK